LDADQREITMIAFLGMGLLGSNFVRALRRRGEEVQVWNRSPDKARALEADGARAFGDPADAIRGAARVHLTLKDDEAVDDVLERCRAGFGEGVTIVDHTTTSPAGTADRVRRWDSRGVAFQHAPVFMGPQNALDSTGFMMASGDKIRFDSVARALEPMTGRLIYLGPDPARAAGVKLIGNLFLVAMTAGVADTLALGKALDISGADVASIFGWFNPAGMLPARFERILGGEFDRPSWQLDTARKDARLMLEAADRGGVELTVIPAVAAEMDRWINGGHGSQDWTVIASGAPRPA
jgi:3-hydroxyisobutyrate dehydrogenase